MTLKTRTRRTEAFRAICDRALEHVEAARNATDTAIARRALAEAYHAFHDATDTLNRAEEEARSDRRLFIIPNQGARA